MRTTRHLPRRLAPLALVGVLALGACSAPEAEFDDAGTSGSGGTSHAADESAGATPEASAPADEPDPAEKTQPAEKSQDPSAYTVRFSNEYKTILTMDRSQVESLTGTDLDAGVDDAQQAMTRADTWSGDDTDLITQAADRESDRIDRVLTTMTRGGHVELRLYVGHHEHAQEAHFGEDGDDD